jgi:anthranilate synthase component 1
MNSPTPQLQPGTFAEFLAATKRGNVIAVTRTMAADLIDVDPLDVFAKVANSARYAFLLESVEGGEVVAKYSFLGADPHLIVRGRGEETVIEQTGASETRAERLTDYLRRYFERHTLANPEQLGPFAGGAVGYLGYNATRWFEPAFEQQEQRQNQTDDALLMFYRTLVVFDRLQHQLRIVAVVFIDEAQDEVGLRAQYAAAVAETQRLANLVATARKAASPAPGRSLTVREGSSASAVTAEGAVRSNWPRAEFERAVQLVQEYILAGDCYQAVISQRFAKDVTVGPIPIYRALRRSNPAPYTYLLKLGDEAIIGASPEMLVRCRGDVLDYRPIAGTRRRGATAAEDELLAREMRADEKEVAEHMMLVDLGRNDLGRVAAFGSVQVGELMSVERYSKVQHLVSSLTARLRAGADRFDALAACFPAGTVTGAPKVRAMEIIAELEPEARDVYAGAVLYLDYAGNLDSCIAIRTIVLQHGVASVQAGAGIVADSVPEHEYDETVHKAGALLRAIEIAEAQDRER